MCHQYWKQENLHIIGSYVDGKIFTWKTDVYQDDSLPIKRCRVGQSLHSGLIPGPPQGKRVALIHHWVEIDCVRGIEATGTTSEKPDAEARIKLEWSDDGGHNFSSSADKTLPLGKVGEQFKIKFHSLGRSYDRRYKITTEANLDISIIDAYVHVSRCTW